MQDEPDGELTLQTVTFPADTNSAGDIFGGWVLSQMEMVAAAGALVDTVARSHAPSTAPMRFHAPVMVGDLFTVYTSIVRTGTTSITVHVESWVRRLQTDEHRKVTEADFTFVAIESSGVKRPLPPE